jgi:hypothetical protein
MRHETAQVLSDLFARQLAELNEAAGWVQANEPPDEFILIRTMIGRVMGALCADAMNPLFDEHPKVMPPHFR